MQINSFSIQTNPNVRPPSLCLIGLFYLDGKIHINGFEHFFDLTPTLEFQLNKISITSALKLRNRYNFYVLLHYQNYIFLHHDKQLSVDDYRLLIDKIHNQAEKDIFGDRILNISNTIFSNLNFVSTNSKKLLNLPQLSYDDVLSLIFEVLQYTCQLNSLFTEKEFQQYMCFL